MAGKQLPSAVVVLVPLVLKHESVGDIERNSSPDRDEIIYDGENGTLPPSHGEIWLLQEKRMRVIPMMKLWTKVA